MRPRPLTGCLSLTGRDEVIAAEEGSYFVGGRSRAALCLGRQSGLLLEERHFAIIKRALELGLLNKPSYGDPSDAIDFLTSRNLNYHRRARGPRLQAAARGPRHPPTPRAGPRIRRGRVRSTQQRNQNRSVHAGSGTDLCPALQTRPGGGLACGDTRDARLYPARTLSIVRAGLVYLFEDEFRVEDQPKRARGSWRPLRKRTPTKSL